MNSLKIVLVGYPGSQCIVPASKYLTGKYLPGFDITYLNYKGEINGWSKFVTDYLKEIDDPVVIFALDDYLISGSINVPSWKDALTSIYTQNVNCIKLCNATKEENEEYPVTTQYTIWVRTSLIQILSCVRTPWEFEILGSKIFKSCPGYNFMHQPCIDYFTNSSISSRWDGIRFDGLKEEDISYIKANLL